MRWISFNHVEFMLIKFIRDNEPILNQEKKQINIILKPCSPGLTNYKVFFKMDNLKLYSKSTDENPLDTASTEQYGLNSAT